MCFEGEGEWRREIRVGKRGRGGGALIALLESDPTALPSMMDFIFVTELSKLPPPVIQ